MPRNKRLELRLTDDEIGNWTEAAKEKGQALAVWIRYACNSRMLGISPQDINVAVKTLAKAKSPFPGYPKSKFKPCKDCDAPGDRCKRFGSPACDPCRKAAAQST